MDVVRVLKCRMVRQAVVGTGALRQDHEEDLSTLMIGAMNVGTGGIMLAIVIGTKEIDADLVRVLAVVPATDAVAQEAHHVRVPVVVLVPDHDRVLILPDAAAHAAATESQSPGLAADLLHPRRMDLLPRIKLKIFFLFCNLPLSTLDVCILF